MRHGSVVGRFLSGLSTHKPIDIVSFWIKDPAGLPKAGHDEAALLYSPTVPYDTIKHARPALTSMCTQLCLKMMLSERKHAVKGSSGLHGSAPAKHGHKQLCWADIGSGTVARAQEILERHQPLTFYVLTQLAKPAPYRNAEGLLVVRKSRPPTLVATEILSSLNFSHSKFARLLPAARSVLFFACGVPRVVVNYSSRVGLAQSWNATYRLLLKLAEQEGEEVEELGRCEARWPILRFDNVQQYHKQRELRLGRENAMKIGVAGYVAEALDFVPAAADLDDRLRRMAENKRSELTVDQLTELIDFEHHEKVSVLHWLQVLVSYVPVLASHRSTVAELFRSDAMKLRAPCHNQKTRIRPLKTVAKNEAVTTELRDTIEDFLEQLGQRAEDYTRRILPMGGDGLTFEKLVQLKNYLQFQDTEFDRLDMVMPFLEIWHTLWTYLSTVFETHYGEPLNANPSTLGHNAAKINQPPPPNLKKVDYYSGLYLMNTVLDARMLDCWRVYYGCEDLTTYFESIAAQPASQRSMPLLDELRGVAQLLYERYSSQRAWFDAMEGGSAAEESGWSVGSRWGQSHSESTPSSPINDATLREPPTTAASDSEPAVPTFSGDRTLAQSILFMSDAMLARDISDAVAIGDIGRVWNDMKILLFKFAGSSHTKYTTYLLEMLCMLELESGPALRSVFLKNWLVNPSGEPGKAQEGDLLEEHLNLLLEDVLSRKGSEWDGMFMRDVVAPNVARLAELRNEWGAGVGLAKRRNAHPEPHSRAEIRTLLQTYKEAELHLFRSGRSHGQRETPNLFSEGARALDGGKLKKFVVDSTRARRCLERPEAPPREPVCASAILHDERLDSSGDESNSSIRSGGESSTEDEAEEEEYDTDRSAAAGATAKNSSHAGWLQEGGRESEGEDDDVVYSGDEGIESDPEESDDEAAAV
ncbi:hypothetical protein FKP32DRAFT_1565201 [Trametes sanguinea]|nr:hypothetical protein FKP32DRAFT_1565201 [Trametes sanguinea]